MPKKLRTTTVLFLLTFLLGFPFLDGTVYNFCFLGTIANPAIQKLCFYGYFIILMGISLTGAITGLLVVFPPELLEYMLHKRDKKDKQ